MFAHVMEDPDICKGFLELVLDIKIDRIEYNDVEKFMQPNPFTKHVFLDVFVKDTNQIFDIEMQASYFTNLGRRLRYYQSAMDASIMRKGAHYEKLPRSFTIFLCTDDPFHAGLPRYTFSPRCEENGSIEVDSGQTWIILNAKAWRDCPNKNIADLLEYVSDGTVSDTPLIHQIDSVVQSANNDPVWKGNAMGLITMEERMMLERQFGYNDGREEGIVLGEAKGIAEGEARYAALTECLLADDRIDDLKRSAVDEDYRIRLFEDYHL